MNFTVDEGAWNALQARLKLVEVLAQSNADEFQALQEEVASLSRSSKATAQAVVELQQAMLGQQTLSSENARVLEACSKRIVELFQARALLEQHSTETMNSVSLIMRTLRQMQTTGR